MIDDHAVSWGIVLGALIYGTAYYIAVIVLGVVWHADAAVYIALSGIGASYLSFALQISMPNLRFLASIFVLLSVIAGALAGSALLFAHTFIG